MSVLSDIRLPLLSIKGHPGLPGNQGFPGKKGPQVEWQTWYVMLAICMSKIFCCEASVWNWGKADEKSTPLPIFFFILQGSRGEKGLSGNPGADGKRVSQPRIISSWCHQLCWLFGQSRLNQSLMRMEDGTSGSFFAPFFHNIIIDQFRGWGRLYWKFDIHTCAHEPHSQQVLSLLNQRKKRCWPSILMKLKENCHHWSPPCA